MYEACYGLRTKPFTLLPDPEFLFLGRRHKMALSLLEYGLVNGSAFIVITGEPGTGKTTLLNQLLTQSRQQWTTGILSNTHEGFRALMPWIMASFSLATKGKDEVELFHEFGRFLEAERRAGRRVLLVLDEAQNVGAAMLEELRLLSNLNDGRRRTLQILLSGQPRLQELLEGPGLVQFAQRIGVEYRLEPLSEDETGAYIGHRLQVAGRRSLLFTALASRTTFRLTGGIPRLINQLCDHALVYGYASQADTITARVVLEAAAARDRHGVLPFAVPPGQIEWSARDAEDEEVETKAVKAQAGASRGRTAPPEVADMQDAPATYREALALKQAGDYTKALVLFDALTRHETWTTKALAQKSVCLKAIGRYEEALATIRAAMDRPPSSAQERVALRYLLARTLEAYGRYGEALDVYRGLNHGQPAYRDVADRLERLRKGKPATWLDALRRGCGHLLRSARM